MTRISDNLGLYLAGQERDYPQFEVGDKVRVLFVAQDPVEGVIVEPTDRIGWVKVEQDYLDGKVQFPALATFCVKL